MSAEEHLQDNRPLSGVRILDIGTALAGPFGATLLGEFGAEVIKVEHPTGDLLRKAPPLYQGASLFWAVEGRNKKSITLNLSRPQGQELLKGLVRLSDAVLENFQPGTLEKWNLGYDELRKYNEDIILTRVSGFGQTGPYSSRPGFDSVGMAMGGLTYLTGYPESPPVRPGPAVCDYFTGTMNALATVIALYNRDARKGKGQWIDVSLYETMFRISESTAAAYDKLGVIRERTGSRHASVAPSGNFRTRDDQWVVLIPAGDAIFARLMKAMGREDLIVDPRFDSMSRRLENASEIQAIVAAWVETHTLEEVCTILVEAEVPVSKIYNIRDIFEDPHYQERGNLIEVEDPGVGRVRTQGVTPRFSATPGGVVRPAPTLGQHNEEIYCGLLGLAAEELGRLREEGVV